MKELSVEEKSQRYDEALKVLHKYDGANIMFSQSLKEEMFPELKEDGDERIRKNIIATIHLYYGEPLDDEAKEMISWLERQADTQKKIDHAYAKGLADAQKALEKQDEHKKFRDSIQVGDKVTRNQDGMLVNLSQLKRIAKPNETKQREKKPDDKVEPRFKIGDWVVRGKTIAQILDIQEQYYIGIDVDGNDFTSSRFLNDDKMHLWTIQDAKNGDVLATLDYILLFKEFLKNDGGISYCHYDFGAGNPQFIWFEDKNWYFGKEAIVHPATKEQRDTFFAKMKEAGYEWDTEKKELTKIENEIEIPFGAKDSELQEATYYIPKGFHAEIEGNNVVIKKGEKPTAWSEEDKMQLDAAINIVANSGHTCTSDWLKSLKDRIQPKQKWDDDHLSVVRTKELIRAEIQKQKQNLIDSVGHTSNKELNSAHHILCVLESFINTIPEKSIEWTEDDENKVTLFMQLVEGCDNYEELSNWLRYRYTWKPSEEQMDALEDAIADAVSSIQQNMLNSLYQNLKKIKGEE